MNKTTCFRGQNNLCLRESSEITLRKTFFSNEVCCLVYTLGKVFQSASQLFFLRFAEAPFSPIAIAPIEFLV